MTRRLGRGLAVLFPYRVVVTVGLTTLEEETLVESLRASLDEPSGAPAADDVTCLACRTAEGHFCSG